MSRQTQKVATRRKVLDAARDLFQTIGYEESTIRAIAERAGVSVGSVFSGFSSKAAILSEVMQERLAALHQELVRVTPHLRGSTVDRLRSIFAIHYAFQTERLRLFLAHLAAGYSLVQDPAAVPFGANAPLRAILRDTIVAGIDRGDVAADIELDLIIDVILSTYSWNYRLAAQSEADSEAMTRSMDRQLGLIFRGAGGRA